MHGLLLRNDAHVVDHIVCMHVMSCIPGHLLCIHRNNYLFIYKAYPKRKLKKSILFLSMPKRSMRLCTQKIFGRSRLSCLAVSA